MDKKRIAEAYHAAPWGGYTTNAERWRAYRALANESVALAKVIRERIKVIEVAYANPYKTAAEMFACIEHGHFHVSTLFCEHPLWTPAENVAFRIAHDNHGHYGNTKGDNQSAFSWRGEIAAYCSQSRYHSAEAQRALFTEIVGQTACFSLTGEFPEQKAILLPRELDV